MFLYDFFFIFLSEEHHAYEHTGDGAWPIPTLVIKYMYHMADHLLLDIQIREEGA